MKQIIQSLSTESTLLLRDHLGALRSWIYGLKNKNERKQISKDIKKKAYVALGAMAISPILMGGALYLQPDETLRVAIMSDLDHCRDRQPKPPIQLERFFDFAKSKDTTFNISLGDNVGYRIGDCSDTGKEDLDYVFTQFEQSDAPMHFVLGDHDIESTVASFEYWLETIDRKNTYYSFDAGDVHIVILDTILGGDPMRLPCEKDPVCGPAQEQWKFIKELQKDPYLFQKHLEVHNKTEEELINERAQLDRIVENEDEKIQLTRSSGKRDKGRIGESQLEWLKNDLRKTNRDKILVFSDHPLFRLEIPRKTYDITNRTDVQALFEELEQNNKEVISISGEAHVWHEEQINGVTYHVVNEWIADDTSWAYIEWGENGFSLDQIKNQFPK